MLGVLFAAVLFATAQGDMIRRLHCSSYNDPMTTLGRSWPVYLSLERPLEYGDRLRFSFVFNSQNNDLGIDLRSYDRDLPWDQNLITLHLRFNQNQHRLVINAHDTPGNWQNNEQSIPWRDNWRHNSLYKIEILYTRGGFEIYELSSQGTELIATFANKHRRHELITSTDNSFTFSEAQFVCMGH
ncbi:unnamed protein product [Caenorhabditis auriculariae]|uniref:Galectin n=1 Tax=Caenorhabditis auriculariae TaxID=2777116 RepID=A0A8S1GS71_9PELO|nr:unnamed protein product [Caenorhabditis auriculariae]